MKTRTLRLSQVLVLALTTSLGACAHNRSRNAVAAGQPAASTYNIPAEDPKGKVYVMSLGGEKLPVGEGGAALYLHLRVAAENQSDSVPWTLDARNQVVVLGAAQAVQGQTASMGPAFAQGSGGSPLVQIPPGSRGSLDLYYPLTSGIDPQTVSFAWEVQRPSGTIAQQTVFQRQVDQEGYYGHGYAYGPAYTSRVHLQVGPGWWWGPYGAWGAGWGWDPWFYGGMGYPWGWGGYWGPGYYGRGYWGGGGYRGSPAYRAPPSGAASGWRGGGAGSGFRGGGGSSFGGGSRGGGGAGSGFRAAPSRR